MKVAIRLIVMVVAVLATLGLGAVSANAQPHPGQNWRTADAQTGSTRGAFSTHSYNYRQSGPQSATTLQLVTQLRSVAKVACSHYPYIGGVGVNIRNAPWGKIIGKARWGERVAIGRYEGDWAFVYFRDRISPLLGYVHQKYIWYPTCR